MTQQQAAELLGVSRPTYQRYELGTIFDRMVPRTIAAAAYGASQAFRDVLPIVATARFNRDPFEGTVSGNNWFRPRSIYPAYTVAIHLAGLRLDGRAIAAGKHKTTGMSFRVTMTADAPEAWSCGRCYLNSRDLFNTARLDRASPP